jgi:hypothetical protein
MPPTCSIDCVGCVVCAANPVAPPALYTRGVFMVDVWLGTLFPISPLYHRIAPPPTKAAMQRMTSTTTLPVLVGQHQSAPLIRGSGQLCGLCGYVTV